MEKHEELLNLMNESQKEKFYLLQDVMGELISLEERFQTAMNSYQSRFLELMKRKELVYLPVSAASELAEELLILESRMDPLEKELDVYCELREAILKKLNEFGSIKRTDNKGIGKEMDDLIEEAKKIIPVLSPMSESIKKGELILDKVEKILNDYTVITEKEEKANASETEFTPSEIHIVQSLLTIAIEELGRQRKMLKGNSKKAQSMSAAQKKGMIKAGEGFLKIIRKVKEDPNSLFRIKKKKTVNIVMFWIDIKTLTEDDPEVEYPSIINKIKAHIHFLELQEK